MPLFDLECAECQHRWEDMVRQDVIPPCPACGASGANKLPTVGFIGLGDLKVAPHQRVEMTLNPDGTIAKHEVGPLPTKEEVRTREKIAEFNAEKKSE